MPIRSGTNLQTWRLKTFLFPGPSGARPALERTHWRTSRKPRWLDLAARVSVEVSLKLRRATRTLRASSYQLPPRNTAGAPLTHPVDPARHQQSPRASPSTTATGSRSCHRAPTQSALFCPTAAAECLRALTFFDDGDLARVNAKRAPSCELGPRRYQVRFPFLLLTEPAHQLSDNGYRPQSKIVEAVWSSATARTCIAKIPEDSWLIILFVAPTIHSKYLDTSLFYRVTYCN